LIAQTQHPARRPSKVGEGRHHHQGPARVTGAHQPDRFVGGATEETIIARGGTKVIVTTIWFGQSYKDVWKIPTAFQKTVLDQSARCNTGL